MNNVIGNQNEKILQQTNELQKLKSIVEVAQFKEEVEKSKEKTINPLGDLCDAGKTENSPTEDFLETMRGKLIDMEKAEQLINDDFEELSIASSNK